MNDVVTYGGGIQSTTIAALIVAGRLPRPERIVMADTGRERSAVWRYLDEVTNPRLAAVGLTVERIPPTYRTVDLIAGNRPDGDILMPVYTADGKLPTFCSNEWKTFPVRRYLRGLGYGPNNPIRLWFGMSLDEVGRMRTSDVKWITNHYPLILLPETRMSRGDCASFLEREGWPLPPKSACWMCPHRDDATWAEMKRDDPADFAAAVALEAEIRAGPWGDIWLHKARQPLDEVNFDTSRPDLPLLDLCADACWT
jgi:hypothetical protein